MNKQERIAIWTNILGQAQQRIDTLDERMPNLDPALRGRILNYDLEMVKAASEFIGYYSE